MKHFAGITALVVSMLAVGCQENTISTPVNDSLPVLSGKVAGDVIELNQEVQLKVLDAANGSWILSGQVVYSLYPNAKGSVLDLTFEAFLTPNHIVGNTGLTSGKSNELVSTIGKDVLHVEKEYLVDGLDAQYVLHVEYVVSESSLSISKMWMEPFNPGGMAKR